MNLAISNIAWDSADDDAIANVMWELGVKAVEVAPTKICPAPLTASPSEVDEYRRWWESRSIKVAAMQALLFGKGDLSIFASPDKRAETLEYLYGIIRIGGRLGAKALVFGSPKNRKAGGLKAAETDAIAVPFFRSLGEEAVKNGLYFCIEPNAPQYDCDWITNSIEGLDLVKKIDHPGVGLHLDAACMTLSGEDPVKAIGKAAKWLRHFHISEPWLVAIGSGGVDHAAFAYALSESGYSGHLSIEMKANSPGSCVESVRGAIERVWEVYAT